MPVGMSKKVYKEMVKKIEHANENEFLLGSSGVVLEVNERGKNFYKSLRDLVEQMYRRSFHLQYKK